MSSVLEELHLHPFEEEDALMEELDGAATRSDVQKLTLYNLEISYELSESILQFLDQRLRLIRSSDNTSKLFVLEILGCTGRIDRVLEVYASGIVEDEETSTDATITPCVIERRLIMQHTHWNHVDASVFAALGMALDGRIMSSRPRDKLCLTLFQPVLSEAKVWTLAQGIQESHHLKELDFGSCCFTPLHVNGVTNIMAEGLRRNQHLELLSFEGCELDDNQIVCILDGLRGHPSLTSLDLSTNKLRFGGMIALATAFSNTTTIPQPDSLPPLRLNLSGVMSSHDDDGRHCLLLPDVIQAWQASDGFLYRLAGLNFSCNNLEDQDLDILLSLLFRRLDAERCSCSLESLDLSASDLTDEGINKLANVIQSYRPHDGRRWKALRLNRSAEDEFTEKAFRKLADTMEHNTELEELKLSDEFPNILSTTTSKDIIHYFTVLNKGGRRILSETVPLGLWPHALERVNHRIDWGSSQQNEQNARLNVIFHLLSQGSLFVDRRGSLEEDSQECP